MLNRRSSSSKIPLATAENHDTLAPAISFSNMATSSTLTISGKVMGKTRPVFTDWQLALPIDWIQTNQIPTLRDLLTAVVQAEVSAFEGRQADRRLTHILSTEQIDKGMEQGKITAGQSELDQAVDVAKAIENALQSFTDGFYCVFIDEEQQMELSDPVILKPNSQMMFLRLMPLVGG
jgi:hypothetical protein